jgi:NYN domain
VDRCALFVDAGYMLADGAMAVHGTRRRESVSWDYEGLLQLLGNLARDRTGLPLLRCYWYEATVEGRRTAEHDALADMPGIKLRLAKLRPGRREGVETEIHRDLTVLASNRAISDAVVVSAEEDLAQVLADVQDLGIRVTIVHVTVDGNWTISRSLRQECDDIMELTSAHLRPYIELIPGAEPARADEQYATGALALRSASNGHSNGSTGSYQALPPGPGHAGPPSIYTAPVVAEYQRPALPLVFGRPETAGAPDMPERGEPAHPESSRPEPVRGGDFGRGRNEPGVAPLSSPSAHGDAGEAAAAARQKQNLYSAPVAMPFRGSPAGQPMTDDLAGRGDQPVQGPPPAAAAGPAGRGRPASVDYPARIRDTEEPSGYGAGGQEPFREETLDQRRGGASAPGSFRRSGSVPPGPGGPAPQGGPLTRPGALPGPQGAHAAPVERVPPVGPSGPGSHAFVPSQNGTHNGPQSASASGRPSAPVSLTDAVQSAHEEGKEFGGSVAREAPALWLEAVLARKPRMPSDLEARLLQGSALPIDFLLHDEVRHALRRGFWDALENSRR